MWKRGWEGSIYRSTFKCRNIAGANVVRRSRGLARPIIAAMGTLTQ